MADRKEPSPVSDALHGRRLPLGIAVLFLGAAYVLGSGPAQFTSGWMPWYVGAPEDAYLGGIFAPEHCYVCQTTRWSGSLRYAYMPLIWVERILPENNPLEWYWDRFVTESRAYGVI